MTAEMIDCPECNGTGVFDVSDDGTSHTCLLCIGLKQVNQACAYKEADIHENVLIDGHEIIFKCLHRGYYKEGKLVYFIRKACFTINHGFITVYGHVTGTMLDLGTGDADNEFGYYTRLYGEDPDHNRYNLVREDCRKILEETTKKLWDNHYNSCR